MPILDNELVDNVHTAPKLPQLQVASSTPVELDAHVNMGGFDGSGPGAKETPYGGLSISELSKLGSEGGRPTFDSPFQMIPKSELLQNKRYALYERDKDMENIYGLHQSAGAQLGNGLLKMGAVAVGTFAQGFATIPDTISAIKNGSLAELSGKNNAMETGVDTWLKNIEDELPNFITRKEQEHPFLAAIPGFAGSANFWGNSIIKNIGFTVGAIGSAVAQDAIIGAMTGGIGEIPLVSGQIGRASIYLNKILSGTNDLKAVLGEINAGEKTAMTLRNLQRLAAAERVTTAARYGLNLYGSSRTEAAIEARDGYEAVHSALVEQHRLKSMGAELTSKEAQEIDDYATNAMNSRFGINMALLTVSNAVQFDNILKPFTKGAAGSLSIEGVGKLGLVDGSLDTFEKKAATSLRDRAWQAIKPNIATVFSEGVYEEGGQYAAEKGVTDYYTRKYKKLSDPKNKASWDWLNESMASTTEGISKQFNSTEGIQNMMIGALSAVITGQGQHALGKLKKGPSKDERLQSSLNILNNFGLTGIMSDKYGNTLDSVGIAKDMTHAAQTGNLNHYKNFQHDMFFNFVSSRIPSGMHESTMEQLKMLKELDEDQFKKMFGIDSTGENQKSAAAYVDKLIDSANKIKDTYDALDRTFKNPFKFTNDPKTDEEMDHNTNHNTFNGWKTELAYQASIADNSKFRLESIEKAVMAISPSLSNDLVGRLSNTKSLMELADEYEDQANTLNKTITEFTSLSDKRRIKDQIKALRTRSENIHLSKSGRGFTSKEFIDTINFELNGRDSTKERVVPLQLQNDLFKLGIGINEVNLNKTRASNTLEALLEESGYKDYAESVDNEAKEDIAVAADEVAEPVIPFEEEKGTAFRNHKNLLEDVEIGREYKLAKHKKPVIRKIGDDRFRVTDDLGQQTFHPTREAAQDAVKDIALDNHELTKVTVLATNEDGTVKVEDISGNIQNISYEKLKGYRRIETAQEKLIKDSAAFAAEQEKIEMNSGTENLSTAAELGMFVPEEKLRHAQYLFSGSISPSEGSNDSGNKLPHVVNSRVFLNNVDSFDNRSNMRSVLMTAKQIEALGLSGLIQMSFDKPASTSFNDLGPINDPSMGFVAQVFVVQENGKLHYSDKEGKPIGEVKKGSKVDVGNVIFQVMPTAKLEYENGDPKYRANQKDQAEGYLESYIKFRQDLFASPGETISPSTFIVTRGHAKTNKVDGKSEKNNVGGILVPENLIGTQEGLIVIPTLGALTDNFGSAMNFPKGTPVLRFGSTIEYLNNRKFTQKEANTIAQVIKLFAENAVQQSISGHDIELVNDYSTYLQNVLYWRQDGVNASNQIHIDPVTMSISIGKKSFPMSNMAAHVDEITFLLQDAFMVVNNKSLMQPLSEPFYEFVQGGGNIVTEDDYVIWDNYQSYLLSAKDTLGKDRAEGTVPLSTKVASPTLDIPYSFEQRYSVIQGMDLKISVAPKPTVVPVIEPIKPAPATPTSPADKFSKYKTSAGLVDYTYTNNEVDIQYDSGNAEDPVNVLASSPATVAFAKGYLENNNIEQKPDDTAATTILRFLAINIKIADNALAKANAVVEPATVETVEEPETVVDSTVQTNDSVAPIEATVVSTPVAPTGVNRFAGLGGKKSNLPGYRAVDGKLAKHMNEKELEIFKAWHEKNTPNIPFEVLDRLVTMHDGNKAWGVFEDGVAKFVKGALRGTEYHEIFEGIYKGMLSDEEQESLLEEFKSKAGTFTDRVSGRKISYNEATDLQAKERIADDFADFRQGKLPSRSLGEMVKNFFNRIINFVKYFIGKKNLKDSLFSAIEKGAFKERTLRTDMDNTREYAAVAGLREVDTHEFIQDMTARAVGILYAEGRKGALFTPDSITTKQMFATIEQQYMAEYYENGFSKMDMLGEQAWKELRVKTLESLGYLGLRSSQTEVDNINSEGANKNDYVSETFTTDWKSYSTGAVKLSIASLPETVNLNQEGELSLVMPRPAESSIVGFKLMNFSRSFATLLDKLSNTSGTSLVVDKLSKLAGEDSNYVRMFQRAGGNLSTRKMEFKDFDKDDWRYFIQFNSTFTKQKPDALIQYITDGEVFTAPANLFTAAKQKQASWLENMKTIAEAGNGMIVKNKSTKTFQVNNEAITAADTKFPIDMCNFLGSLGIDFPFEVYNKLKAVGSTRKTNEQIKFTDSVKAIQTYLGVNQDILSMTNKTTGINTALTALSGLYVGVMNPNQESTFYGVDGQQIGSFADNNAPSLFENEFNEAGTLEELLEKRPELNDKFSKHSQILKKGGRYFDKNGKKVPGATLKVGYIQGTKDTDAGKGKSTSMLTIGDRFTQEINQNINGNYYILIPADSSTEWMMNLGNSVAYADVQGSRGIKKINDIFIDYLKDDIALALDARNREHIKALKGKGAMLRFFNDMLYPAELKALNNLIAKGESQETIEAYINGKEVSKNIGAAVQAFLGAMSTNTREILSENNQIVGVKDGLYAYDGLGSELLTKEKLDKYKLTDSQINNIIAYANTNYVISNIEYHKLLFGDPLQFTVKKNGVLDQTKRVKAFLSPRRLTFDSPEFNTHLNQKYNVVNGVTLKKGDPGYHFNKPYTNTVTFTDVETAGSLSNILPAYAKTNEADAASWVMDNTYKEIKIKNGQWSEAAEAWHQWHMAYTRQNYPGYTYSKENAALEEHDIALVKTKEPYHKIEILKPIVSGNKYGKKQFDLDLDKLSQMPMYFKMIQGTTMEKLYVKMIKEDIGYVIMESGRKVGAETNHQLYVGGEFNESPFESVIQIPWKIYGIQVETASEGPKSQTRGSQLNKVSSMDLYENGVAISEAAETAYIRNKNVLDKMHQNAYKNLLKKMGVIDTGNGFAMHNGIAISNMLMQEMSRREVSDNTKDSVRVNEDGEFPIPFEASPSYIQIRSILYATIDKALISPKMNGGAHVQIPATMFEQGTKGRGLTIKKDGVWTKITKAEYNSYDEATKKKVMLTDDTLKFYTEEDPYCEILVPHWFKATLGKAQKNMTDEELLNYLNNSVDGKQLLQGIAFRIPTQALSSVEVFRVKGFLPQYMGSTVVVPSEITTKAGSDFDIDKLNMYMKNAYLDRSGDVRMIKYYESQEESDAFFGKVFDDTLNTKELNKLDLLEAIDISMYNLPDPKGLLRQYGKMIESFAIDYANTEEEAAELDRLGLLDADQRYDGLVNDTGIQMSKLTDENIQSVYREVYQSKMYKASLENEYYESLEQLVTLPENFQALITPIGDGGLEDLSEEMDRLRGYSEAGLKNKILDRNFLSSMRNSFLTAKRWVGIAAVNITGLSIKQKSQIYIDPARIAKLDFNDKKYLGDGMIALPHNTITINGSKYISLSGVTVKDSEERISDRLSGYATAFVDVARGDYITKIIQSDLAVGVFMFLENIGVGDRSAYFCNQPIITEYLNYLDSISAKSLYTEKHLSLIRDKFAASEHDLVVGFDVSQASLEKNMKDYYTTKEGLSNKQNVEQQNILTEFLKYAKMADFNFKFTQAINYDTSSFRSAESMTIKQWKTEEAEATNIISSASKAMNTTFIGEQASLTSSAVDAMGTVLKLDSVEFKAITNVVLRPYADNQFTSGDTLDKIAVEIKAAFIDYVVQTHTGLNMTIKEALVDDHTAVVYQLAQAKVDYPELQILQDLDIVTGNRDGGAKSIKLIANTKAAYDENLYTGMMRELRDHSLGTNKLFKSLVNLSILQGTYGSAISIRNIVPLENYAEIVGPIISQLQVTPELKAFTQGMFQRNNFRNQDVMPRITNLRMELVADDFNDMDVSFINTDKFPVVASLGSTPFNRGILVLSEKYNSYEVQSDFLAMPRMQLDPSSGMMIDMNTGTLLHGSDFAHMKQKGDQSLYDVYGYQKVKMKNGLPLIHTKVVKDEIVRYQVYKLVNLYGDGDRATENYGDFRHSVLENGSVRTEEVDNARIIEHYSGMVEENDVTLPTTTETQAISTAEANKAFGRIWEEHAYEILDKFPTMDREQYDTMSEEEKDNLLGCL